MTSRNVDGLTGELAWLACHDVDASRADRLRQRCLAELAAANARAIRGGPVGRLLPVLEDAAAFGLAAVYIVAAFGSAIALYR